MTRSLLITAMLVGFATGIVEAHAAQLFFDEDLVLDPTGTEAEFGRIGDVAVAPDGTIYVADEGFGLIHAFDEEGNPLRSFGTVGEGPGDLPQQMIRLDVDDDGNLVIGGMRSFVSWLDPTGNLVRSVQFGTVGILRSLEVLPDGRLLMSWTMADFQKKQVDPLMAHIVSKNGKERVDFARSTWWKPEYPPLWAQSLVGGQSALLPTNDRIVFLQGNPYEIRLYDLEGHVLERSSEEDDGFTPPPNKPEDDGNTIRITFTGGAWPLLVSPRGWILSGGHRIHPDDVSKLGSGDPDFRPRRQNRYYVYDFDLELQTTFERDEPMKALTFDPQGRLWCRGDTELPTLVRYRLRWEDDPAN